MSDGEEKFVHQGPKDGIVPVISLRDYFAAAAVTGFIASQDYPEERIKWLARQAYLIADAMLGSREE
jgi:hypothetical protein